MIASGKIYLNTLLKAESSSIFSLKIKEVNIVVLLKW